MGKWVCLVANSSFHHGDKDVVAEEIKSLFGDDLEEARIVCDDAMEKSGEYFVFVNCSDYFSHIEGLIQSPAVARVVSSFHEPSFICQSEVDEFSISIEKVNTGGPLIYGDIVLVKDTDRDFPHLTGLTGVVIGIAGDHDGNIPVTEGFCEVFFRFCTTSFREVISVTSIELVDNVFKHIRVKPFKSTVVRKSLFRRDMLDRGRKAASEIVSGDKICRKKRRAHEATYYR